MSQTEWRDVLGHEGSYQVSRCGKVRSLDRLVEYVGRWGPASVRLLGKELRPQRKAAGYLMVSLGTNNQHFIHRLVALAFIPNPAGLPTVDHINGIRTENDASNLRWASRVLNSLNRAYSHGKVIGVLGVSESLSETNPYKAAIRRNGRNEHLGVFSTVEEASSAYQIALKGTMEHA